MKRLVIVAAILCSTGCVGLVQIGKGPLVVGHPAPTPSPEVKK